MSKLLFIAPDHGATAGGREQLSRLYHRAIAELLGDELETILLPHRPIAGRQAIGAVFTGRIDGATRSAEERILGLIAEQRIERVWLDGSNLGALAGAIRRQNPAVRIISFFHNVEPRFFLGAFRERPSLRAAGIVAATFVAERKAVRASDRLVMLNARDSRLLKKFYGRAATDVLPMTLAIPDAGIGEDSPPPVAGDYLLFVGGGIYANQAGILWFAREVAPHLDLPTVVVGRGMERLRPALAAALNMILVGEVADLGPYYRHARAVVAPIFDGSGMKTKVAEALMHGKPIAGTAEAFTGYEELADEIGWRCDSAEDFVGVLKSMASSDRPRFDPALRLRFDELYSYEANRSRIATIIGDSGTINEAARA